MRVLGPGCRVRGLIDDLEQHTLASLCPARSHHGPQRSRNPPVLTDHLSDVVRGHVELEDDSVVPL